MIISVILQVVGDVGGGGGGVKWWGEGGGDRFWGPGLMSARLMLLSSLILLMGNHLSFFKG